jgi:hypothetical protein
MARNRNARMSDKETGVISAEDLSQAQAKAELA